MWLAEMPLHVQYGSCAERNIPPPQPGDMPCFCLTRQDTPLPIKFLTLDHRRRLIGSGHAMIGSGDAVKMPAVKNRQMQPGADVSRDPLAIHQFTCAGC